MSVTHIAGWVVVGLSLGLMVASAIDVIVTRHKIKKMQDDLNNLLDEYEKKDLKNLFKLMGKDD